MAQLPTGQFDASQVDPTSKFDVIPKNDYPAMIVDSEMKRTKANDGSEYLNLTLEIIDGPYKGRNLFDRLNLVNKNQKTVEIAQRALSQICHATGVMRVTDSTELHHKPMLVSVDIEPGKLKDPANPNAGKYPDKNEIKSYKPMPGSQAAAAATAPRPAPAAAAPQQPQAAAAPVTSSSVPPWARKAS